MFPVEKAVLLLGELEASPHLLRKRSGRGAPYWVLSFYQRTEDGSGRRKRSLYLGSLSCLERIAIEELLQRALAVKSALSLRTKQMKNRALRWKYRDLRRAANYSVSAAAAQNDRVKTHRTQDHEESW
jgi:hypothetical protein